MADQCVSDAVLQVSVESLQVDPGLMAVAVVLGVLLGVAVAALLSVYVFLPRLRKKDNIRRLSEEADTNMMKRNESKKRPREKKMNMKDEPPTGEMLLEDDEFSSAPGDIAAFASRAKVIYPINQKFRPLADGASNPSLHENAKQAPLPNQMLGGSSSSSLNSLSQEGKDDCSSSTTVHSATSDERFYGSAFVKVTCFPDVLTCDSFDVKLCLYSLRLKGLPLLDADLRQEKHVIFVQILRLNFTELLMKKKIDGELFRNILSTQESELKEAEEQFRSGMASVEISGSHDSAHETLEDLARKERGQSDHLLQDMESFWKQLDKVQSCLLEQSQCTSHEARKTLMAVTEAMITAEGLLSDSQDVQAMDFQEKMIRWEHMAKVVDSLKSQIQHESECRLNAVSATLEQLISKRKLSVRQKEHQLTELLRGFWEEVTRYNNECLQQTKDLILKLLQHRSQLMEKLHRTQKGEQVMFLNQVQQSADPVEFLKDYHNLLEKQREHLCDLEEEEDCNTTEAVADLCKELYSGTSQAFEKLVKELLLKTLPSITTLTSGECETLRQEMRQNLVHELEKADTQRKRSLKLFQEQLLQEKQMWAKEYALSAMLQNHLAEKHDKILLDAISRLSGLGEENAAFVIQRHKLLLYSVLRMIALRIVAMATQAQMKVCRKRSLLQELREQHSVASKATHCPDENKWQLLKEMEAQILEKEQKVEEESEQARREFHQELLAELREGLLLLQQHMEQMIGQVLVKHAQQEAADHMSDEDSTDFKERLIEAAVESVYVTNNGVNRLVQNFYEEMLQILQSSEKSKVKRLKEVEHKAENGRIRKKKDVNDELMKEKMINENLTATSGLHQRLLLKRTMLLGLSDVQQNRLNCLKQKKLVACQMERRLEDQLKEAEQKFMSDLASMARVQFKEGKQFINQANQSAPNMKAKSKNPTRAEKETPAEFHADDHGSFRHTNQLLRNDQQNFQVMDTAKSRKALKKRDN
ncbi:evC complex member EVC isoform X2 [Ambystoma mexicanum]|uniref:evC complex member EVC isoform X2 n=1 Tax=Ambystoma mexicanum TaxID=8296 RepID=UPI0037E94D32